MSLVAVSTKLAPAEVEALRAQADAELRTVSAEVRRLVREGLMLTDVGDVFQGELADD